MEKIKIAYVRTQFWFNLKVGGSVSHTIGVLKGFRENSCEIKVFSNEDFLGIENFEHHLIKPNLFKNRLTEVGELLYNFYARKKLEEKLREYDPAFIYHRFSSKTFFVSQLAKKFDIPLILEFNGSGYWLSNFDIYKKNPGKRFLDIFRKRMMRSIENNNFKNSTLILVVSIALKKQLLMMGIPEGKIMVIPNGVDIDKFNPRISGDREQKIKEQLQIYDNKKIVGFVGTFGPWHGIENLTSAIYEIKKDDKNNDIVFLLMGDGVLKKYSMDRIGNLENVIFTGSIPYSEIQDYLSICDVLVSPHSLPPDSKEFIGSPTKIFEYMAMGKGIVASNLGQIGRILENSKTAILIEPDNVNELAKSVLKLVRDERLRNMLGKNAVKDVSEKYTWTKNISNLVEYLKSKDILK